MLISSCAILSMAGLLGVVSSLSTPKHDTRVIMSEVRVIRDIVFFMVDVLV